MRRQVSLALLGLLALAAGGGAFGADEKAPLKLAFVGPLTGPLAKSASESLAGIRYAAEARTAAGGVKGRVVAVETFDDKDDPSGAEQAYAAAVAAKADFVFAAETGRTVEAFCSKAKKGKTAVFLVGSAGPKPTLDKETPLLFIGGWPVDHAISIASLIVVPCASVTPGIVVEDTPRGAEVEAAVRRNVGPRHTPVGTVKVPPGGAPPAADLARLKAKLCDRLVLVGEPDLIDRTEETLAAMGWDVPILAGDGMLSDAAGSLAAGKAKGAVFVAGLPQSYADRLPRALEDAHEKATGVTAAPVPPRTILAWAAADLAMKGIEAAWKGPKPPKEMEVLAAVRDLRYGADESGMPMLDHVGRSSLVRWRAWQVGKKGPEAVDTGLLPIEGFGPLLRMRPSSMYVAEPGTKVCWVTFGDEQSKPPRTIEKDAAALGLGTRGYEGDLDAAVLEELTARTLAKLSRLFLKNEDGTGVPGVSFAISFTAEKPKHVKPSELWTMVVAGDDPDAGGRAFPGESRCEVYATFLRRTIFQPNALEPKMSQEDKKFMDGTYVHGLWRLQHLRADQIRCLVDGYAGSFSLTGAHECGHLAGLGHDVEDPRSIMNVTEGVGLRETQAWWIPSHAAVLERLLGRYPDPSEKAHGK